MAKKKDKRIEDIFEQTEIEPVEGKAPETEPVSDDAEVVVSDDAEVVVSDAGLQDDEENLDAASQVDDDFLADDELSDEHILDDVRRSLIEESAEEVKEEKKSRWWQKLGKGRQKAEVSNDVTPVETSSEDDQLAFLDDVDVGPVLETQEDTDESIADLIEMLATDENEKAFSEPDVDVPPAEGQIEIEDEQHEAEKIDVDEQKKRAFQGSAPDDEDFNDVRAVALDGGEEVFVEVEVETADPMEDRIKSFENTLRPYRRYINFAIAFIGMVAIVAVSGLMYNIYRESKPQVPTPTPSNLPYPVRLNIVDGGFSFNLGRGRLEDGGWNPKSPEWLEGTEVCRWVAILYSRPLEAALRTLTQKDQLELVMSNNDVFTYDVYSITQMSIDDMQAISSNSPCLLVVLADSNTDTRLVVTAYPH